ncbi:MAG: UreE urease accessory protein [Hydrocarboniphaga sp.]|uniref:urease accessory protein UreE n=1 Tax=Hydrocarboniphaga sp. TaxID=2033016 RepID=UPI00261181E4|nr:urease accessory protein UreE [Hydrocarboniphaga sp.]MDB5970294.1 UreE urease accessory protein [Hydrocarboniphaga sp.]
MQAANEVLPAGTWPEASATDHITLDYNERHRRRYRYVAQKGTEFLLDLARATVLNHGDGLKLEDGTIVKVEAAEEALTEIRASSTRELIRLAWHIGNRHLPAQLDADRILIREDHVITDMLRRLGAEVRQISAPFTPESGAYANAHAHEQHGFVFLSAGSHER